MTRGTTRGMTQARLAVISAEEQTAGRGRYGKRWLATKGKNCTFSIVFVPQVNETPFFFAFAVALALREFISSYGLPAMIKWPNDILVHGKKIAGVLVETKVALIIGVGLNVLLDEADLASINQESKQLATSLSHELQKPLLKNQVEKKLIAQLVNCLTSLCEQKISTIKQSVVKQLSWMIGSKRTIEYQGRECEATIVAIHDDGSLEVEVQDKRILLASATVF
jgi:BirA family transcriptional regulator, biotin operon repressor / biotin---[acetyl-CoA-carboxylase] ligase